MRTLTQLAPRFRVLLAVVAVGTLGCGDRSGSYTPDLNLAEAAVRGALDAWKAGLPPGELPDSKPVVHVTDGGRKAGQTLEGYELLGETRSESGRAFAVRLRLANPKEDVRTQYVVVGIDPVWVFRNEDYELLMHWDHHMPPEEETNKDGEAAPSTERR